MKTEKQDRRILLRFYHPEVVNKEISRGINSTSQCKMFNITLVPFIY